MMWLDWIGARARYVLFIGCALALFLPAFSSWLRPALPWLVSLVFGLAIARIDMGAVARRMIDPRKLVEMIALSVLIMPVTAVVLFALCKVLPEGFTTSAVLFALAPPISSAASLCFILGYDARRSLEVTLVATLLTPLVGPVMIALLLPDIAGPAPVVLMGKLALMIIGGLVFGIGLRALFGAGRIAAQKLRFDGVTALVMVLFVVPLFDGVGAQIVAAPGLALAVLVFCVVLNLGSNYLVLMLGRGRFGVEISGAFGLMWGNRTVALYLAALPFDPVFSLFVGLYQFPMYATPLLFRRFANVAE